MVNYIQARVCSLDIYLRAARLTSDRNYSMIDIMKGRVAASLDLLLSKLTLQ